MSKSLPAATAFVQTKAGELRIFIQSGAVQQAVRGWFARKGSKLDWSIVSKKGETRFQHVMKHGSNNLQKQNHGIFYGDPIKNTNNAWLNKGKIKPITQGGSDLYIIPYKNAGYTAGYAGQGTNLNYITIVTKSGTNQIITAFPSGSGIPLKF